MKYLILILLLWSNFSYSLQSARHQRQAYQIIDFIELQLSSYKKIKNPIEKDFFISQSIQAIKEKKENLALSEALVTAPLIDKGLQYLNKLRLLVHNTSKHNNFLKKAEEDFDYLKSFL